MAERPWIDPMDVLDYTSYPSVKERSITQLEMDIARAEDYVVAYCRHDFTGPEYETVPASVKRAVILIAELYAANAAAGSDGYGLYQSETYDDYSYTLQKTQSALDNMVLGPLLDPYIQRQITRGVRMDAHVW